MPCRFLHLVPRLSLPLLLALAACTTTRAEPSEAHAPSKVASASLPATTGPSAAPPAAASSSPPPATAAPPALSRCDALVGHSDGAGFAIHVPRSIQSLAGDTLTVCRNGACASATIPPPHDEYLFFALPVPWAPMTSAHVQSFSDGWSEITVSMAFAAPTDGDAYVVRLDDASGRAILDVDRRLTYHTVYPLGRECPNERDTYAGIDLWPTSKKGLTCNGDGCDSRVQLVGHLVDVTRLFGAHIEICRGTTCVRDTFPIPRGRDPKSFGGMGMAVGAFSSDHKFMPGFSVMPDRPGGPWTYRATISGEPAAMTNGDRYSFTLKAADGSVIATFARAVTYEESRPNGPECDAYACKNATIEVE